MCAAATLRQADSDCGAASFDAGDRDLTIVQLDQPFGNRQTEAGALRLLHARRLRLMERPEQVWDLRFRDADASIGDADLHASVLGGTRSNQNRAGARRE